MNDYRVNILFTSRADASLSKVVSATRRDMDQLGAAGKGLGKALSSGAGLGQMNSQLTASGKHLKSAKSELASFEKYEAKAGATNAMLTRRIGEAQRNISGYARSLRSGTRELRNNAFSIRREVTALRQLRGEYSRTGNALGKYGRQRRGAVAGGVLLGRGRGFGGVRGLAAGVAGAGLTKTVLDADLEKFRLSTVINNRGESKQAAMLLADAKAEEMAKGGVSSLAGAYGIQYALNSGSLSAQNARAAAPIVGKVSTITGGMAEQVGEVLTTAYNNLAGSLEGTEGEKFKRIGELLTKVQFKYQIRDFGQLGESMKYGSAAMASYNVNLASGAMLMGRLNSAGLQGGMAGTAFTAMLRGLSKAQDKWNISLVRDQKGQLDLIETLRELEDATANLDVDEKAAAIQQVFGDEGARAVTPLLAGLNELKQDLNDVESGSKGIVDQNFSNYLKTTTGELKKLTGTVTASGVKLGSTFLPIINSAIPQVTSLVDAMGQWAAANPGVVKGLGAIGVSLLALKAGSALLKPVVGLVKGGAKLFGRKGGGLFGRRGKAGKGGLLGGLLGAAAGATPVRVVNWPGGGLGGLLDIGGVGGRKTRGRGLKTRFKAGRKGILGGAARLLGRAGAGIGIESLAASPGLLSKAGGFLSKGAGKLLGKSAGKIGLKAVGKGLLKKIPVIGLLAGLGFGVQRALAGDWLGAAGEVASGAASLVPGVGTAASLAIDAGLAARDIARESESQTTPQKEPPATPAPELAATPVPELSKYAGAGESTLNVNVNQTVNAPGADAESLKDVLSQGRVELKRTIEDVVKQYFWAQQRTGLNNA
jgi:TP901 family phage tail tape measure protein